MKTMTETVRLETAAFVEILLDDADYFSDVESFILTKADGGFTPENIQEMMDGYLSNITGIDFAQVDMAAAARSLNEEFGYEKHSVQAHLTVSCYTIDELGRQREDLKTNSGYMDISTLTQEQRNNLITDLENFAAGWVDVAKNGYAKK